MYYSANKFEGFELSGKKDLELDEYKSVTIQLETDYKWGSGWSRNSAMAFDEEMNKVFPDAGYIIEKAEFDGSCDRLKDDGKTDIYMHPMEFTGVFRTDDIEKIQSILDGCKTVYGTHIQCVNDLYKLDNETYRGMIYDDADRIAKVILSYPKGSFFDVSMDFAEATRIQYAGNRGTGYSSFDTDVSAVEEIKSYTKKLLDEKIDKKDIPFLVKDAALGWKLDRIMCEAEITDKFNSMDNTEDKVRFMKEVFCLDVIKPEIIAKNLDKKGISYVEKFIDGKPTDKLKETAEKAKTFTKNDKQNDIER